MYQALIATTEQEHRLYRLQAEWRLTANADARLALASQIRQHPEWGIAIGPDGPVIGIASQTHQKSNLRRLETLTR